MFKRNWIIQYASYVLRTVESIVPYSVYTGDSTDSYIKLEYKILDTLTSDWCTDYLQKRIIPIHRYPATSPLRVLFLSFWWYLNWSWFISLQNIILLGYFRMHPVLLVTSSIPGRSWFWTDLLCSLGEWWNRQPDTYRQLVVEYIGTTSCRGNKYASSLGIQLDWTDWYFGYPACLAPVSYNC